MVHTRLSSRPDRFNNDVVCFGSSRNFAAMAMAHAQSEQKSKRLALVWKIAVTLSFSFQINISVKITVWGLLRYFCGNLDEKFVSDQ